MPAVQLRQLEQESHRIAALFLDAPKLVRALDHHYEKYALRSKRQGKIRRTPAVLIHYEIAKPVDKQLRRVLAPLVQKQAKESLKLIDALWQRRTLEHRQLSIYLLGQLPQSHFRNVSARLQKWSDENRETSLMGNLADEGCLQMREHDPKSLLLICQKLLKKRALRIRASGLLIINHLIAEEYTDQLPAILDLLTPLAKNPIKGLRSYLIQVMESLSAVSPGEALYFIQQLLSEKNHEGTRWLARQSLKFLPIHEATLLEESIAGKTRH